ncbi:hypothetical protein N8865_02455 [Francisellaceae bacterium]|nr:hypothetical protein [Francisellaceae bacterium]
MRAKTRNFPPVSNRSALEVYWEHIALRFADDVQTDLTRNYSDSLVLISNHGNFKGKLGLKCSASILYGLVPDTNYTIADTVVQGDWVTERWGYYNSQRNVMILDGIDSFLISEGQIQVKMINYNVTRASIDYLKFCDFLDIPHPFLKSKI